MESPKVENRTSAEALDRIVSKYEKPRLSFSLWQIANSVVPYLIILVGMFYTLKVSYWLTLFLSVVAAGFLLRIFIIFHDCTHGAFFSSKRANIWTGRILGVLLFTPFRYWQHEHAQHHATAGNLDERGLGDIWTMTIKEYQQALPKTKMAYRLFRNPLILFVLGPPFLFLIRHRFILGKKQVRERNSIRWTNLSLLAIFYIMHLTVGLKSYFLIQVPVIVFASCLGVWLFYVQHQFEGVYWERQEGWDYLSEALEGSSFYKLPKVFQWFTGNIGFHHVHHLSPKIPNYNLEACHCDHPAFLKIKPICFLASLKSLSFRLWDEEHRQLVGYNAVQSF